MERNLAWGRSQLYYITNPVIGTNRTLNNYYVGTFEKGLSNCHTQYNTTYPVNYTHCLADVVSASNSYTAANQRTFSIQLETAKGTSNVYAKQTHEWCFAVQNSTITNLQRATTLIDQCLHEAEKEGSGCDNKGYYCENVLRLPSYLVDYKNLTMVNPFHGRNNTEKCLTLDIWYGAPKAV
uniref:Uncharacterized protein n=1 Tax=Musca domestica TaxID=7370 RepID=T1PHW4_MUSDO